MKAIYLTGFMGAGKTTIGKALSQALSIKGIDTDQYIEKKYGETIASIFAEQGEEAFRKYETEVLYDLPVENILITTGGGIILKEENRRFMKENGTVIYLHCDPEEILRRVADDESRPLLIGDKEKQIKERLEARIAYYLEADHVIDTTALTVDQVVKKIIDYID
ncbi:shikimate kinase [Bacillus taeanensis]|uniref:Shikimate kinase n=1 Tax=Bacillus taeanensis TaxID=273032 RepID=A0A366XWQ7_9BACI|nr:shikimate kinase [Bacillus taeanensis]RBW70582.1 shikimate kinase [Bacillus taeanensis]